MMLSFKVLGFIKQAVVAYYYGATALTDIYFIAWGFVSGVSEAIVKALSVSIVAIYTSLRVRRGKDEAAKLINGLVEIIFPLFLLIMMIIIVASPLFTKVLAPTYSKSQSYDLANYIRVLAPVMLFSSIELVFGAVLDSHKSFFVPRLQSLIYSLSTIIACIFLSSRLGISALVISQYASYFIFTFLVIIAVRRYHSFFVVRYHEIPELQGILMTALPLFIGNSALQINQIVDKSITSGLGEGAASALSYCHTLEQFVTNIMIVNIGNVMFANFAEFVAEGNIEKIKSTLSKAIDTLIIMLFGISIITIICSKDIVSIVYYRGSFTYDAVVLTSTALVGYALSFVAVAVRDLSIKSLYAFKDTRLPMKASMISIIVNIILSILLSRVIGILGVSVATSVSAVVGMIINGRSMLIYIQDYDFRKHIKTFISCLPAGVILVLICISITRLLQLNSFITFILSTVIGFALYFTTLNALKVKPAQDILHIALKRAGKNF
jgi:putative peptidoglycan lipid II flippase